MAKGRKATSNENPARHTVVISDVESMYWKLSWDIQQFDEIQRNYPEVVEPLAYAAINVCISAVSLRDWTVATFVAKSRANGKKVKESIVVDHIHKHVLQQAMCEAIANTAKHARFHEGKWEGGSVRIDFEESDEDDSGGLVLRHIHEDGAFTSIALNAFMSMDSNWWAELQNLGFAFPRTPPEWRQRQLQKIFGAFTGPD